MKTHFLDTVREIKKFIIACILMLMRTHYRGTPKIVMSPIRALHSPQLSEISKF